MTEDKTERGRLGQDLAFVRPEGAAQTRISDLRGRVDTIEDSIGNLACSLQAIRHIQTVFLSVILLLLGAFIAATIVFGFMVNSDMRALNARLDLDIQARASDQAAADARLDRFIDSESAQNRAASSQPLMPPLRSRP